MDKDIDAKWVFVEDCLQSLCKRYDIVNELSSAIMLSIESPLLESLFMTGQDLIKALSLMVDDRGEWIDWFVNENDFGRRGMEAGQGKDMRVIDNYINLRWVIELV